MAETGKIGNLPQRSEVGKVENAPQGKNIVSSGGFEAPFVSYAQSHPSGVSSSATGQDVTLQTQTAEVGKPVTTASATIGYKGAGQPVEYTTREPLKSYFQRTGRTTTVDATKQAQVYRNLEPTQRPEIQRPTQPKSTFGEGIYKLGQYAEVGAYKLFGLKTPEERQRETSQKLAEAYYPSYLQKQELAYQEANVRSKEERLQQDMPKIEKAIQSGLSPSKIEQTYNVRLKEQGNQYVITRPSLEKAQEDYLKQYSKTSNQLVTTQQAQENILYPKQEPFGIMVAKKAGELVITTPSFLLKTIGKPKQEVSKAGVGLFETGRTALTGTQYERKEAISSLAAFGGIALIGSKTFRDISGIGAVSRVSKDILFERPMQYKAKTFVSESITKTQELKEVGNLPKGDILSGGKFEIKQMKVPIKDYSVLVKRGESYAISPRSEIGAFGQYKAPPTETVSAGEFGSPLLLRKEGGITSQFSPIRKQDIYVTPKKTGSIVTITKGGKDILKLGLGKRQTQQVISFLRTDNARYGMNINKIYAPQENIRGISLGISKATKAPKELGLPSKESYLVESIFVSKTSRKIGDITKISRGQFSFKGISQRPTSLPISLNEYKNLMTSLKVRGTLGVIKGYGIKGKGISLQTRRPFKQLKLPAPQRNVKVEPRPITQDREFVNQISKNIDLKNIDTATTVLKRQFKDVIESGTIFKIPSKQVSVRPVKSTFTRLFGPEIRETKEVISEQTILKPSTRVFNKQGTATIQQEKIRLRQSVPNINIYKSTQLQRERQEQKPTFRERFISPSVSIFVQPQLQKQLEIQLQRPKLKELTATKTKERMFPITSVTPALLNIPKFEPPRFFLFKSIPPLDIAGEARGRGGPERKFKYQADVTSLLFGITRKGKAPKGILSGGELRPIYIGGK